MEKHVGTLISCYDEWNNNYFVLNLKYLMSRAANNLTSLDKWKHQVMSIPKKRPDKEVMLSGPLFPT